MAIPFRDFFEFLFNGGKGIRTNQLDGEITQAQLADDTGIREYVGESFTHDSVNNRITGNVRGLDTGDTFERYSRMIAFSPDPLGRQSDALRMVAHTVNLPLVDRDGQPVSARQITPGRLYEILQAFSAFAFIQPLGLRPQDYKILSAISEDETFTEAEILAGTESPTDSNVLNTPIFDDFVSRVSIRERGSGYTSAPTVQFSGGGGTGAAATAEVLHSVQRVTLATFGSDYTSAPTVQFSGGGGTGAAATAIIGNGFVIDIRLTDAGTGYTSIPTVTLTGGGGTGATANATVGSDVESITVTAEGAGYTSAPTVTLSGGGGTGADARAILGANRYLAFGVPDDTGDISGIILRNTNELSYFERVAGTIEVTGRDYKFWRSRNQAGPVSSDNEYTIEQLQEFA